MNSTASDLFKQTSLKSDNEEAINMGLTNAFDFTNFNKAPSRMLSGMGDYSPNTPNRFPNMQQPPSAQRIQSGMLNTDNIMGTQRKIPQNFSNISLGLKALDSIAPSPMLQYGGVNSRNPGFPQKAGNFPQSVQRQQSPSNFT